MPINVLFSAHPSDWDTYSGALSDAFERAGLADIRLSTDHPPADTDYIVYAPTGSAHLDFTPFTKTKAVLSLWAGVERIVANPTLTMPLARMVDPGMTQSMVEWVTGHVMRYHLGMDAHIVNPEHRWAPTTTPLAAERRVCVLGLGALGSAVAQALQRIGFAVHGWSRGPKTLDGIPTHRGPDGLQDALACAEIVVLLLPNTPATENTLNAKRLAQLPKGAFVINPGRGALIDDDALLVALDSGQVAHATLDVFRVEPLPREHPFWAHPRVTVTPHIAAETRARTASQVIAENIRRCEAGLPLLHLVDRSVGY